MRGDDWEFLPEEKKLKTGDLVRRCCRGGAQGVSPASTSLFL